jgi:hypothetical protein
MPLNDTDGISTHLQAFKHMTGVELVSETSVFYLQSTCVLVAVNDFISCSCSAVRIQSLETACRGYEMQAAADVSHRYLSLRDTRQERSSGLMQRLESHWKGTSSNPDRFTVCPDQGFCLSKQIQGCVVFV